MCEYPGYSPEHSVSRDVKEPLPEILQVRNGWNENALLIMHYERIRKERPGLLVGYLRPSTIRMHQVCVVVLWGIWKLVMAHFIVFAGMKEAKKVPHFMA